MMLLKSNVVLNTLFPLLLTVLIIQMGAAQTVLQQSQRCTPLSLSSLPQPPTPPPANSVLGLCASNLNYPIALPPNATLAIPAEIETVLSASLQELTPLRALAPNCYSSLVALTCASIFPKCSEAGTTQVTCQSSCQQAFDLCAPVFTQLQMMQRLQTQLNCTGIISPLNPQPFAPASQCLAPDAVTKAAASAGPIIGGPAGTSSTGGATLERKCPPPFLPAASNVTALNNKHCDPVTLCCLPCPITQTFYPQGQFSALVLFTQIAQATSCILVSYIVFSWAVLPGRRQHPGDIVLHFAIAVMVWQSTAFFLAGNPKRIQCIDDVTTSTATNNTLCAFQGAILAVSVHATVLWAGYMIANLHATIVWRSSFFEKYKPWGVIVCWALPGVWTVIPFSISQIDALTGTHCLVVAEKANLLFFSFQAPVVIIAFILNCATMIYLFVVTRRNASALSRSTHSSSNSNNNNPSSTTSNPTRSQMLHLLKLNWRSLLLGFVFIFTYTTYVIFFNLIVAPTSNATLQTPWVQSWVLCLIESGGDQSGCHAKFDKEIPDFGWMVVAQVAVASVGLWIAIIFGWNVAVLRDWGMFFSDGYRRWRGAQLKKAGGAGSGKSVEDGVAVEWK
ncbi:hypothetical protein HDV05_007544 [Chytridiales sp. JEL 0842]|nr:hypothetical protein HDV05_007544 [Chytridiales sp. JEL 0842]